MPPLQSALTSPADSPLYLSVGTPRSFCHISHDHILKFAAEPAGMPLTIHFCISVSLNYWRPCPHVFCLFIYFFFVIRVFSSGCSSHGGPLWPYPLTSVRGQFQSMTVRTAASVFRILCQKCVVRRLLRGCVRIVSSLRGKDLRSAFTFDPVISETGPDVKFGWMMVFVLSYYISVSCFFLTCFLTFFFVLSVSAPTDYQSALYHLLIHPFCGISLLY